MEPLAARNGRHDEKRLRPARDRLGEGLIGRFQGKVALASKEAQERPAALSSVIANGPAQHRLMGFERIEDGALRRHTLDREPNLAVDVGMHPQMRWEDDADHGSVCTSTDNTAGRSRTMGVQLSPASLDAYTWPPVVPK